MKRLSASPSPWTWVMVFAVVALLVGSLLPPLFNDRERPLPVGRQLELVSAPATGPVLALADYRAGRVPAGNRGEAGCQEGSPQLLCYITEPALEVTQEVSTQLADVPGAKKKSVARASSTTRVLAAETVVAQSTGTSLLSRESAYPLPGPMTSMNLDLPGLGISAARERFERDGLTYFFPSDTEQRSYPFFDPFLQSAVPIDYADKAKLGSVQTFMFHQDIPPVALESTLFERTGDTAGSADLKLRGPAKNFYSTDALGRYALGPTDAVVLEPFYTVGRDVWVEPTTGTVVGQRENFKVFFATDAKQAGRMVAADDTAARSLLSMDMQWSQATQDSLLAQVRPAVVRGTVVAILAWAGKILGALLLGACAVRVVLRSRAA